MNVPNNAEPLGCCYEEFLTLTVHYFVRWSKASEALLESSQSIASKVEVNLSSKYSPSLSY